MPFFLANKAILCFVSSLSPSDDFCVFSPSLHRCWHFLSPPSRGREREESAQACTIIAAQKLIRFCRALSLKLHFSSTAHLLQRAGKYRFHACRVLQPTRVAEVSTKSPKLSRVSNKYCAAWRPPHQLISTRHGELECVQKVIFLA